jgi:hypothetical protein
MLLSGHVVYTNSRSGIIDTEDKEKQNKIDKKKINQKKGIT